MILVNAKTPNFNERISILETEINLEDSVTYLNTS